MYKSKIITFILISLNCVSYGYAQDSQQQAEANKILSEIRSCIQNAPKNKFSMCAYNLNQNISNKISDSDPFKSVGMIYSTKLYVVLSKYERNQISQEDLRIGLMTADADLQRDIEIMQAYDDVKKELKALEVTKLWTSARLYSLYWMTDDTLNEVAQKIGISKSTTFLAIKKIRKHMSETIKNPFH
jgi:hypothetical protein